MAAAKARQVNGGIESPERDRGAEATPSGNMTTPDSASSNIATGVRLHHRAVSTFFIILIIEFCCKLASLY